MPEGFSDLEARLTETARASLERAGLLAHTSGSSYIGTEHVLLGVLAQNSSLGAKVLAENGVTLDRVETVLDLTNRQFVLVVVQRGLSSEVMETIRAAWQLAVEFGQEKIGTEHIIYSILMQENSRATTLLREMNIDIKTLQSSLEDMFDKQQSESMSDGLDSSTGGMTTSDEKVIKKYGTDLTEQAKHGFLDPVIGRSSEMARIITVLGRRSKNNPALIGEPGVGKTAVIEGLAQRIVDGDVPEFLLGKRLVRLNLAAMVAGTKFRGQFEERLQKLLAVVKKHQEIILFIDELHLLIGAGSAEGSMDAANALKPALSRGEIRVIGATTFEEYRKHIEKDSALARRFQTVVIKEPTPDEAVVMVTGLSKKLSDYHKVEIPDEIIQQAVALSERYVADRQLPDKAIDVLDEAAALQKSQGVSQTSQKHRLARQIKQLAGKIDAAVESENYERAAHLKVQMMQLEKSANEIKDKDGKLANLTEKNVREAVSAMTGVPVSRLDVRGVKNLTKLEQRLSKQVLGQDEAVSKLSKTIRRAKSGLTRKDGPLGSFVFLGPTGVGKTELAKVLAREVFGGDGSLIKIDMSEFTERHAASRLVGAPAGYVGYDDGGKLTDRVRRQPYSVVLFDEVEKAHPDVMNLLLQILEDGVLTDSTGRTVSFKNTIVILTSNVGADQMVKDSSLGFGGSRKSSLSDDEIHENNSRAATRALERIMKPELIGRFDSVVTFRTLSRAIAGKIFDNMARELSELVSEQGYKLKITAPAKRHIIAKGFDEKRGARALRRTLQSELGDRLSDVLLSRGMKKGATLKATLSDGEVKVEVVDA